MSTQPIERPPTNRWAAISDNTLAVNVLLGSTGLPAPTVIPLPEAVHVSVADVDDLGLWLAERGGEIHVSPAFEGVQLWTLHTTTPERADGSSVSVLVSAAAPADQMIRHDILTAVVR
ncbi:hypothetical protein [Streptomyces sp. NPDC051173]|uniref:hypothetical protein n=1 Tax=Streptomyces sp. NPDC051173 TaxID=3155164 RepID=UPI00344B4C4A